METPRKKLLLVSLLSWLACLGTVLGAIFIVDGGSLGVPDLLGATGATFVVSLVVVALLYVPGLRWLRRRLGGCSPAVRFPLMSALVLNAPVFLITALMAGRALVVAEAFIFMVAFIVLGAAFGLGFVWTYREETFP